MIHTLLSVTKNYFFQVSELELTQTIIIHVTTININGIFHLKTLTIELLNFKFNNVH